MKTISYRGAAHRNGCLRVGGANGSAWFSCLQESQIGHPQSAKKLTQERNGVYVIIRCEIKLQTRADGAER